MIRSQWSLQGCKATISSKIHFQPGYNCLRFSGPIIFCAISLRGQIVMPHKILEVGKPIVVRIGSP
jgi:hypothetical protein